MLDDRLIPLWQRALEARAHKKWRNTQRSIRYKARKVAKGLCRSCSNPVAPNRSYCTWHLQKEALMTKARRERKAATSHVNNNQQ